MKANGAEQVDVRRAGSPLDESGWKPEPRLLAACAPPHSVEAEQGVLGSMLIAPATAIDEVSDKVAQEAFFVPGHQIVFGIILGLWREKKALDLITFTQVLRDNNLLEQVGGEYAVAQLFTVVPTAAMLGYYLEIVIEKFQRREVIRISTDLIRRAYQEEGEETKQLLDDGQAAFTNLIQETAIEEALRQIGPAIEAAYESIVMAYKHRGKYVGLETGFYDFDRMTGGLKGGQLVIVAGRPAMGKSAFALNIAEHIAVPRKDDFDEVTWAGKPVALFSLEMSTEELMERLLCSRAQVSITDVRQGFLTKNAPKEIFWPVAMELYPSPLYVDPTPALKLHEFRARARRARTKFGVEVIIVDYLQLMKSTTRRSQENRVLEISEITATCKELAKELNIPIILLAQLNRDSDKRTLGRPKMSDLRESGSTEQDADIVGLLYRKEYYTEDPADAGKAELIVAKHRNGAVGSIDLGFDGGLTRFRNMTKKRFSNNPEERQK